MSTLLTKYPVVVPGAGSMSAPGMIIGEAPGRKEIEQGIPFCGKSGEVLNKALDQVGSSGGDWYITNAFKGDVGIGNRNPTQEELDDHRGLLEIEITTIQPRGILLLGRIAAGIFIPGIDRMGDIVGKRFEAVGTYIYPCWHPSYILRMGHAERSEFDFTVAKFVLVTKTLEKYDNWIHD